MINMHMKVPPPKVTGTPIPGDIKTSNETSYYKEAKARRQQASDELRILNKKYQRKDKHKTPTSVKVFGGIILSALMAIGLKKFIKK